MGEPTNGRHSAYLKNSSRDSSRDYLYRLIQAYESEYVDYMDLGDSEIEPILDEIETTLEDLYRKVDVLVMSECN